MQKYRLGKKQKRAILEIETGREYLVFPQSRTEHVEDFLQWLNNKHRTETDIEKFVEQFLKSREYKDGVYRCGGHGFRAQPVFEDLLEQWEQSRQPAVSGSVPSEEELMDDRDEIDFEDEIETEEERRQEIAYTCRCGAWSISKTTGRAIQTADCFCGAE